MKTRRFISYFLLMALLSTLIFSSSIDVQAQSSANFSWTMPSDGLTSAGVFDSNGNIVRTLWAQEKFSAGTYNYTWDGLDDFGKQVPAASYTWKVLRNDNTYVNKGVIGNTGLPAYTSGHVPIYLESIATDAQGNAYTVNGWDEPHFDVIKWSGANGQATWNTGHHVNPLLYGIAVEPDGSAAYVSGFHFLSTAGNTDDQNRAAYATFTIWKINLTPGYVSGTRRLPFTYSGIPQITSLPYDNNWYTGDNGGDYIPVYAGSQMGYPSANYPTPAYPSGATEADREVMSTPLRSLAVYGNSLYVTDALGGRILKYDKVTGEHQQTISGIPLARGLVIDGANNRIWVGHEHTKVSVYDFSGNRLATPITDLTEVTSLALQGNTLVVSDSDNTMGKLRRYTVNGTALTQVGSTFGQTQRPGDRNPDRMRQITSVALDSTGNVFLTDRIGTGSRMQKFTPDFSQSLWQQLDLEFSATATYSPNAPDQLFSSHRSAYQLDKATGGWTFLGATKTDTNGQYFGNYDSTHNGVPRAVHLGSNDFLFYPAGDSVAIYRIEPPADADRGPTCKLASVLGGSKPSPDGVHREESWRNENRYLWEWNDTQGDGQVNYTPSATLGQAGEVNLVGQPFQPHNDWCWVIRSFEVDDAGTIWFTSANRNHIPEASYPSEGEALYAVPMSGLNSLGNPIYHWADAVKVMDDAGPRASLGIDGSTTFEWKMVGSSSQDQRVYALASSNMAGLPQDGATWMGGNILFCYEQPNPSQPKWRIPLPKFSVGISPIPGAPGGAMVGINPDYAVVGHYTKDGLLIGSMEVAAAFRDPTRPDGYCGRLDAYLALNCHRDPRDGLLDVFVEDNMNHRVVWFRVDDSRVTTVDSGSLSVDGSMGTRSTLTVNNGFGDGKYPAGTTVNIYAGTPPVGKVFSNWSGASVVNPTSTSTTIVMPSDGSAVTVTANYTWKTGNDMIRFHPHSGAESNMSNSVWEVANDINGPWTPVYDIPDGISPASGWNEKSVDLGGARYVRWRCYNANSGGALDDLEWYRNGVKLTGTAFASISEDTVNTYNNVLDGNINTFWVATGAVWPGPHVGIDTGSGPVIPSAPAGLTATAGNAQISLSWTASSGATSYNVKRSTTSGGPYTTVSSPTVTSYTNTGLTNGTTYYYVVTAVNANGESDNSSQVSATPSAGTIPAAPTGLTATAGDAQASLSWTASSGATSYNVKRATTSGGPYTTVSNPTVTSYTNTGLTNGTTYYYVVTAVNANGESGNSSQVSATPTVSGTGTGLLGQYYIDGAGTSYPLANPFTGTPVLTRTDATVDFDWGDGAPDGSVTSNYFSVKWTGQVKAPVSGAYTFTVTGDDGVKLFLNGSQVITNGWKDGTATYTYNTTLTAGTLYNIELHFYENGGGAICKLHWSYPGQSDQAIPQSQLYPASGASAPSAPTGLTATAGDAQASLSWTASSGATSYNVKRATTSGGPYTTVSSPTGTSYTNTGLTNGTTYYYVVTAVNASGESGNSSQVSATPTASSTGTGLLGQYYIDGAGTSYPLVNPFTGTPVLTRTDATVDFDWGDGAPDGSVTSNYFSVKWTGQVKAPVSGSYTFTVTGDDGVKLFLNGSQVITDGWVDGTNTRTYTTNLTAGTLYDIELHFYENGGGAICKLHWSYPGQSDQAIPQSQLYPASGGSAPSAPTGLTATAGDAQVSLSWTASSGATSYNVKRATTSGGPYTTVSSPTGTSYTNTGLTNGTTYYYVVTAVNANGESGNSSQVSAAPAASGIGTGLLGQYYIDGAGTSYPLANPFTGTPVLTRTDATVDFDWGDGAPDGSVTSNYFSVKWTGQVKAPVSGSYTFTVTGDDGVKLFLNGSQVITDGWVDGTATYTYNTTLTAGTLYNIELHFYENGGGAICKLHWSYPGQSDQAIPQSQLYPASGGSAPSAPTGLTATAGDAQVSLSWTASTGATSYNVYRGTTAGGESATALYTGITGTAKVDTGLTNGTTYYYIVKAVNSNGTSGASNETSASPNAGTLFRYGLGGATATADGYVNTNERPALAFDDSVSTKWCATGPEPHWLSIDLGASQTVTQFVVKHAAAGTDAVISNTRDFKIQKSDDGINWTDVVTVTGNTQNVTTHVISSQAMRYVRLYVTKSTSESDTAVRIFEFEIWGN